MPYIALSKKQLARISYHSFGGIKVDLAGSKNLSDEIDLLQNDPEKFQSLKDSLSGISSKSFLFRGLYWLFNINNYRTNYYIMQGYYANLFYTKGLLTLNNIVKKEVETIGGFAFAQDSVLANQFVTDDLSLFDPSENGLWFYNKISKWFNNSLLAVSGGVSAAHLKLDSTMHFVTTETMLQHLNTLGIVCKINDQISLIELKEAKRINLLRSHPDHNNGQQASTTVQSINNAYDQLIKLINPNQEYLKLLRRMDDLQAECDKTLKSSNQYAQNVEQLQKDTSRYSQRVDQLSTNVMQVSQNVNQFGEHVNQFGEHVNQFGEHVDQFGDNVNQLAVTVDEYSLSVDSVQKRCGNLHTQQQQNSTALDEIEKLIASRKRNNAGMFPNEGKPTDQSPSLDSSTCVPTNFN